MATASELKELGSLIRKHRKAREWTLAELEKWSGVRASYLSNIERGYVNPKRGPTTPSDEVLKSLSVVLGIPVRYFHATLGRATEGTPVVAFIKETASSFENFEKLTEEEIAEIGDEVEDYVTTRILRRLMKFDESPAARNLSARAEREDENKRRRMYDPEPI